MLREISKSVRERVPSQIADMLAIAVVSALNLKRKKGVGEFMKSSISAMAKSVYSRGLPVHVTIEPTNICNLKCPVCETGAGVLGRPKGSMSMETYKVVLDKLGGNVNTLFLYWMGEPFLNRAIYEMARRAKARGIWVETCTNGENVLPDEISGFNRVGFEIGGMTGDTHKIYRIGGDIHKSINNMIASVAQDEGDKVSAGFIVMKHNEHEVERFVSFCSRLGIKECDVIVPCVRNIEQADEYLPVNRAYWFYDEVALQRGVLRPKIVPNNSCPWVYYSMVVAWNGDVYPCCRDVHGEHLMGNLLEQSLEEIWYGDKYRAFRQRIHYGQSGIGICRLCSGFGVPLLR